MCEDGQDSTSDLPRYPWKAAIPPYAEETELSTASDCAGLGRALLEAVKWPGKAPVRPVDSMKKRRMVSFFHKDHAARNLARICRFREISGFVQVRPDPTYQAYWPYYFSASHHMAWCSARLAANLGLWSFGLGCRCSLLAIAIGTSSPDQSVDFASP